MNKFCQSCGMPSNRPALDAAISISLHIGRRLRRASEAGRSD